MLTACGHYMTVKIRLQRIDIFVGRHIQSTEQGSSEYPRSLRSTTFRTAIHVFTAGVATHTACKYSLRDFRTSLSSVAIRIAEAVRESWGQTSAVAQLRTTSTCRKIVAWRTGFAETAGRIFTVVEKFACGAKLNHNTVVVSARGD